MWQPLQKYFCVKKRWKWFSQWLPSSLFLIFSLWLPATFSRSLFRAHSTQCVCQFSWAVKDHFSFGCLLKWLYSKSIALEVVLSFPKQIWNLLHLMENPPKYSVMWTDSLYVIEKKNLSWLVKPGSKREHRKQTFKDMHWWQFWTM